MADVKLDDLPEKAAPERTDVVVVDDAQCTKRATAGAVADLATPPTWDEVTGKPTIPSLPSDAEIGEKAFDTVPIDLTDDEKKRVTGKNRRGHGFRRRVASWCGRRPCAFRQRPGRESGRRDRDRQRQGEGEGWHGHHRQLVRRGGDEPLHGCRRGEAGRSGDRRHGGPDVRRDGDGARRAVGHGEAAVQRCEGHADDSYSAGGGRRPCSRRQRPGS